LRAVNSVCPSNRIGEYSYDESALRALKVPPTRLDGRTLSPMLWQYSRPTRFGEKFGPALLEAELK
jgi:hypothetical protein